MPNLAAEFTIAAIQAGTLSANPEAIAGFYNNLVALLAKSNGEKHDVPASHFPVSNAIKQ
jgi:hypothetical protein